MAKQPPPTAKRGPGDGSGKDALLEATIEVVGNKGLRGLTFRAVGEAAGVNNSLIAHYFGTRDALIEAAFDRAVHESIDVSHLDEFPNSREGFIDSLVSMLASNSAREIFVYEMVLEAHRRPEIAERVSALYDDYVTTLSHSLREALGERFSAERARYAFAALDGLVLQRLAGVSLATIRETIGVLWDDVMKKN
jgi:AcrR family transcriptional regulator